MGQLPARSAQLQRHLPMLLGRVANGEMDPGHPATHPMPLTDGVRGYEIFEKKEDACPRSVLHPAT